MSTIGFRVFSCLDDGMGYASVEKILDTWQEEGIENSQEILKVWQLKWEKNNKLGQDWKIALFFETDLIWFFLNDSSVHKISETRENFSYPL